MIIFKVGSYTELFTGSVRAAEQTLIAFPTLMSLLQKKPNILADNIDDWPSACRVLDFFIHHPKPNRYIRELDIPNIDTKFITRQQKLLKTLLDEILPPESINDSITQLKDHGFEKRFGLKYEAPRKRFRCLDPQIKADLGRFSDLEVSVDEFASLDIFCDRVFITENKMNGVAFPRVKNAIVIFGLGYGVSTLKSVDWLRDCRVYYWGDIDTHGFAMLSQIRGALPKIQSFLMDEQTLLECKAYWGEEPENIAHNAYSLPHLTDTEQQMYASLKESQWQQNLRLEKERIPYKLWQRALSTEVAVSAQTEMISRRAYGFRNFVNY